MALFKRKKDQQVRTCPECCQIVSADTTQCDLCGAQLTATGTQTTTSPPVPAGVERS